MLNFRQNLYVEEHDFKTAPAAPASKEQNDGQHRPDIGGVSVRLSNVLVTDNNTPAIAPFPGYAKIYFLSIVASNLPNDSMHLSLKAFDKVGDNDALHVDKMLFEWQKERTSDVAPAHVHILTSLIKSKQPLRDVASILSDVYRDNSYKLLTATLNNLIKGTTPLPDLSNLIFNIAGITSKYLGKVDEKPLLTWYQSFTSLNADFNPLGTTERMAANRHASMSMSLVVGNRIVWNESEKTPATTVRAGL